MCYRDINMYRRTNMKIVENLDVNVKGDHSKVCAKPKLELE